MMHAAVNCFEVEAILNTDRGVFGMSYSRFARIYSEKKGGFDSFLFVVNNLIGRTWKRRVENGMESIAALSLTCPVSPQGCKSMARNKMD